METSSGMSVEETMAYFQRERERESGLVWDKLHPVEQCLRSICSYLKMTIPKSVNMVSVFDIFHYSVVICFCFICFAGNYVSKRRCLEERRFAKISPNIVLDSGILELDNSFGQLIANFQSELTSDNF